jgi:hypothetical protein
MTIEIDEYFKEVNKKYVGMSPNTTSIKPVHISNGLFRRAIKHVADTKTLNRFVFWQMADGSIPKGHELDEIFQMLVEHNRIDNSVVSSDSVKNLRVFLKKILDADKGVFQYGMDSYSSGYEGFISKDSIGQNGGELIAHWLETINSPLLDTIKTTLYEPSDIITALCYPLLENADISYNKILTDDVAFLNFDLLPHETRKLWRGLKDAAETLNKHIKSHPNKFFRLRMVVLFSCFVINRHLSTLEACYVPGSSRSIIPFLLDFSNDNSDPLSKASTLSYTFSCQSISRFYSWAFSDELKKYYSISELTREDTPTYLSKSNDQTRELWSITIEEAKRSDDPYLIFGQAVYDIMALLEKCDPTKFFGNLGIRSGLLWPPNQTGKRFVVQQDMLEMLVRASIEPGDIVDLNTLQNELWNRFGIVIGGRQQDDELLLESGIYQADNNALRNNREKFAARLSSLGFAKLLADGVLQIELEVINA